jgi:hypothetical protein
MCDVQCNRSMEFKAFQQSSFLDLANLLLTIKGHVRQSPLWSMLFSRYDYTTACRTLWDYLVFHPSCVLLSVDPGSIFQFSTYSFWQSLSLWCKGQSKSLALDRLSGKSGTGSKKSGGKKDGGASASVDLTTANFDKLVIQSDDIWLVEFFAPWYTC